MEIEELVVKIGKILDELKIPYAITGGFALAIWGRPRFTADIDLVVEILPSKLDRLANELLLVDKGVYIDKDAMEDALQKHGEFNFIHPASGIKVDFWVLKDDLFSRTQIKRRVGKKVIGKKIFFVSSEDLILSKLTWYTKSQSTRHTEDIEAVLKRQKKLDFRYIKKWARVQSTEKVLNSLLATRN